MAQRLAIPRVSFEPGITPSDSSSSLSTILSEDESNLSVNNTTNMNMKPHLSTDPPAYNEKVHGAQNPHSGGRGRRYHKNGEPSHDHISMGPMMMPRVQVLPTSNSHGVGARPRYHDDFSIIPPNIDEPLNNKPRRDDDPWASASGAVGGGLPPPQVVHTVPPKQSNPTRPTRRPRTSDHKDNDDLSMMSNMTPDQLLTTLKKRYDDDIIHVSARILKISHKKAYNQF